MFAAAAACSAAAFAAFLAAFAASSAAFLAPAKLNPKGMVGGLRT